MNDDPCLNEHDFPCDIRCICGVTDQAVDMVDHPPHYQGMPGIDWECIELIRWLSFDVGNACKYVWRADRKNGLEDLRKALWYIKDAQEAGNLRTRMSDSLAPEKLLLEIVNQDEVPKAKRVFFEAIRCGHLVIAELALDLMIVQAS